MGLEYAAHVDHPISHSSDVAALGISLAAAAIATIVVVYSGGTALLAFGPALEALGTVATAGDWGMKAGKIVDKVLPDDPGAGQIKTGNETVLLGPDHKQAARAMSEDSVTKKCHEDKKMAEGSRTVMIGDTMKPMTRRGDRTKCDGKISDGIHSIIVGGDPSAEGQPIEEEDSWRVKMLSTVWSLLSAASTAAPGDAASVTRAAVQGVAAVDPDENSASLLNAAAAKPSLNFKEDPVEAGEYVHTLGEGAQGGANIVQKMFGGGGDTD